MARQMPVAALRQCVVEWRVTSAVAVAPRGACGTREAYFVASALERARDTRAGGGRGAATRRRAPRGTACGPLPAGRCIDHSHTSSVTHASQCVRAVASIRAQRLRNGDRPSRRSRRRRAVYVEPLPVAYHTRDPLGSLAVPPLDDWPGRRAPREAALGRCEDGVALRLHQAVGAVRAGDGALGIRSHREARDAKERGLLLESAGV